MNPSREQPSPMRPVLSVGRYALFDELAAGGMATVHFGRMHAVGGFNKTVAIKRMRRDIGMDPEFVAMFLDEARLTSRIEHPNVVATIDVVAEAGEVFLVLEYVRGESLERLRRAARSRREHIPVPVALGILCGTLAGLHAAHEAVGEDGVPLEIIHRDVSPQNILVGEDGVARISDFGIAKAESRLQVTREGQMKGKLPYMAPEQLAGRAARLDRRVDIFSAAVVLWELLAGRTLFRGDHPGETIGKVLSAPIPSLCTLRADVPRALDQAVLQALSRPPGQRPPTAEAFAVLLEESVGQAIASPRAIGAWVGSLAAEVLESRLKYVREMESVSQLDATRPAALAPIGSTDPRSAQANAPAAATPPPAHAPRVEESSLPSGAVQSYRPENTASTADFEASLRGSRSKRLVLMIGAAALLLTGAFVVILAAVFGTRSAGGLEQAPRDSTAAQTPPAVTPPEPSSNTPSLAAPSSSASASTSSDDIAFDDPPAVPARSTSPASARPPPPKTAPTRPYLPDMP